MFGHSPIQSERDRRVKVYLDNSAVSASTAQSEYSRFPNFIGDRFTAVTNTVSGVKTYDIALKYADKIIPYEAGVAKGVTPGYLNFDGDHFDVSSLASQMYTVTSTGRTVPYEAGSAKGIPGFINFDGTHFDVSTIASNQYTVTLPNHASYLLDEKAKVYVNDVQVGSVAAHLNFSTEFTATYDAGTLRHDIALAGASYLPDPTVGQFGILRWRSNDVPSKEGIFGEFAINENIAGTRDHGDDADGIYVLWQTGGTDDDNSYIEMTSVSADITPFVTRRDYNPHLYGKVKITGSSFRMFIGFHTNEPLTADNNSYLVNASGFGFSYSTDVPDTNYQIRRNDGDGTEDKTSMGVAYSSGTLVTFHIWGNSSGWFWSINGGAASAAITTEVPAASTRMHITARLEQIGNGGTAQEMKIYYLYYKSDK